MTLGDNTSKLLALDRARQRLEVALADDEGWRALRRLDATPDRGGSEAGRLEIRMLSNPLYRAWKNLNAAIEARQSRRPADSSPASVMAGGQAGVWLAAAANVKAEEGGAERRGGAGPSEPAEADRARAQEQRPPSAPIASALQQQAERVVAVRTPPQEASVSFIMRVSRPPPARAAREQREAEPRQPRLQEGRPLTPRGAPFADAAVGPSAPAEEAEVAVVSVAARRHAGTVERLLRALHGEEGAD